MPNAKLLCALRSGPVHVGPHADAALHPRLGAKPTKDAWNQLEEWCMANICR